MKIITLEDKNSSTITIAQPHIHQHSQGPDQERSHVQANKHIENVIEFLFH